MAINAIKPIKVLLSTRAQTSTKGYPQVIKHFRCNGAPMVEITTDLGKLQGVREVYYDPIGAVPQRVIDKIADRVEIYTSAMPEARGVYQQIGDARHYLPNVSIEKLAEY